MCGFTQVLGCIWYDGYEDIVQYIRIPASRERFGFTLLIPSKLKFVASCFASTLPCGGTYNDGLHHNDAHILAAKYYF